VAKPWTVVGVCLLALCSALGTAQAADWPQWGGRNTRNMVSPERHLPASFDSGAQTPPAPAADAVKTPDDDGKTSLKKGPEWQEQPAPTLHAAAPRNVKWVAPLATHCYGTPVVAAGKVVVGANCGKPHTTRPSTRGGGAVLCLQEATGQLLWQLAIPRFRTDDRNFNFDDLNLGICSTAAVDANRVYLVSNRAEVLCLDAEGLANGNDGPFQDEAGFIAGPNNPPVPLTDADGDILWLLDMIHDPNVDVWVQDAADCSILVLGDYLYVCTSNGTDQSHRRIPRPNAPSLLVLDKHTGRIVARDDARIGPRLFHGEWSSPSAAEVGGRMLVFHGGGDGVCYAFDAQPAPPSPGEKVGTLKTVWRFDVNAAAGRTGKYRAADGPSEIISTPVFHHNRVYCSVGQDPVHGRGRGELVCIDATQAGDITESGLMWVFAGLDRSLSTVAVSDGLLYAADNSGRVFCLDADTGKLHWTHDTEQPICSSPLVADGRVYLGTDRGNLFVFAHAPELTILHTLRLGSAIACTPTPANGVLFVATQHRLYAAAEENQSALPARLAPAPEPP